MASIAETLASIKATSIEIMSCPIDTFNEIWAIYMCSILSRGMKKKIDQGLQGSGSHVTHTYSLTSASQ
jgi:hypothetical protein